MHINNFNIGFLTCITFLRGKHIVSYYSLKEAHNDKEIFTLADLAFVLLRQVMINYCVLLTTIHSRRLQYNSTFAISAYMLLIIRISQCVMKVAT